MISMLRGWSSIPCDNSCILIKNNPSIYLSKKIKDISREKGITVVLPAKRFRGHEDKINASSKKVSFSRVIFEILLLDIVFSLDSVITAVGMADHIEIMIAAVVIAVLIMLISSESISRFVNNHPTVKMLALSFLLLIGVSLIAEGLDQHIPKGYIYFAMAFSVFAEMLNLRAAKRVHKPD